MTYNFEIIDDISTNTALNIDGSNYYVNKYGKTGTNNRQRAIKLVKLLYSMNIKNFFISSAVNQTFVNSCADEVIIYDGYKCTDDFIKCFKSLKANIK